MEAPPSMCACKGNGRLWVVESQLIGGLESAWPSYWTLMSVLCNVTGPLLHSNVTRVEKKSWERHDQGMSKAKEMNQT